MAWPEPPCSLSSWAAAARGRPRRLRLPLGVGLLCLVAQRVNLVAAKSLEKTASDVGARSHRSPRVVGSGGAHVYKPVPACRLHRPRRRPPPIAHVVWLLLSCIRDKRRRCCGGETCSTPRCGHVPPFG